MAESLREQIAWFEREGKYLEQYRQTFLADFVRSLIIERVNKVRDNVPDPDPHGYDGEWEALIAGKEAAIQAVIKELGGNQC